MASSRWVGLGDSEPRMCPGFVLHACALAFPLGERSAASRCFQDVPQSIYQVYSQALLPDFLFFLMYFKLSGNLKDTITKKMFFSKLNF